MHVKGRNLFLALHIHSRSVLNVGLLFLYAIAIIYDLPAPTGNKYKQNLTDKVLLAWGAVPVPSAQPAAHWWDKTQGLRGWSNNPEGWVWGKNSSANLTSELSLIFLGIFGAALLWFEYHLPSTHLIKQAAFLIILIFYIYAFQITLLSTKSANAEQLILNRITDKDFTGYFTSALQFSTLGDYFSGYVDTLHNRAFCSHCRTHPPGPILYYWSIYHLVDTLPPVWLDRFTGNITTSEQLTSITQPPFPFLTAWIGGNIILFVTATIVIPLYGLARRFGRAQFAFPLAALGAVIPGILLMSPQFDQLYAVFIAWLLYFAIRGLQNPNHAFGWGMITGLVFAFSLYWSIGLLVMVIPLFFFFLWTLWVWLNRCVLEIGAVECVIQPLDAGKWLLGIGLGWTIPWIILVRVGKFPLFQMLQEIRQDHIYGVTAIRPYISWLFFNLADFLQFLGLPLGLVVLFTLIIYGRGNYLPTYTNLKTTLFSSEAGFIKSLNRFLDRMNVFSLMFWLVIILLNLSGTTRGEVGRLWIFLMPLAVLALYQAFGQNQLKPSSIYQLLAAQFLVCSLIGISWITP